MSEFIITGEQLNTAVIAIQGQLDRPINEVFIDGDKLPELVRCRDCKFYILDEFGEAECHQFKDYYDQPVHWPEPDGFCAWGARREEER